MKTTQVKKTTKSVKPPEAVEAAPKSSTFALADKIVSSIYLILSAFAAFIGAQLVGPFLLSFIVLLAGVNDKELTTVFEANAYLRFLLILVVEVLTILGIKYILKRRQWTWQTIGLGRRPTWNDAGKGILIFLLYLVIYYGVYLIEIATKIIDTTQMQQLGFEKSQGYELIAVFLSLVILPPIAEEILFRGLIFFGLRKKLKFIHAAIITSVLFGIAHLEFGSGHPLNWAAAIDTFTLSMVLCYAAEKTKSLWPGVIVHATKNLIAFLYLFVQIR